jgi:hypothetical protein
VPETPFDDTLEQLLAYPPDAEGADADRFVVAVMDRVKRERRRRRVILGVFGLIGALFGVAGAALLAEPIGSLFTETISPERIMQVALLVSGAAAFHVWIMGDDLPFTR